jgi:hypothetical protein
MAVLAIFLFYVGREWHRAGRVDVTARWMPPSDTFAVSDKCVLDPVSCQLPVKKPYHPNTPPQLDLRMDTVAEANSLAGKIENIGNDYEMQILGEIAKQLKLEAEQRQAVAAAKARGLPPPIHDLAAEEHPFSELRKDEIRKYEIDRYNSIRDRALSLRSKMLENIPDIPMMGDLNSEGNTFTYKFPTHATGLKDVAKNLRELAAAYAKH